MRRFRQQLPHAEAEKILTEATNGVLSLTDTDGRPYGVPMSFVYDAGRQAIYFHCAREGRKMDCVRQTGAASFCVVALDDVRPQEFTTYFRSAIVSGKVSVAESRDEMVSALRMLAAKYSPGMDSAPEISKSLDRVAVIRLDIESLTGKEAMELTRKRQQP